VQRAKRAACSVQRARAACTWLVAPWCVLAIALACSSAHESNAQPSPAAQGSGGINRAEHRQKPSLLVISFDGFRADYLDRFDLPNFRRVMTRGTRARGMHPVFPTITFPNHYSLVTGLYPEHHGIVENSFYDPVRKDTFSFRNYQTVSDGTWFGGEPIWVTAERQGMVSACFFWPGSEADIKGIRPTHWNRYDGSVPNEQRIETVLGWLRLPADRRPHVITLYFSDVDSASHKTAIGGPNVAAAVTAVDRALGLLLDGLDRLENRDRVLLMLTSDHGMADTGGVRIVQLGDVLDTTGVRAGFSGPVTALHVSPEAGTAAAVRDRINAKLEHGRAYLRQEVPERHHFRATPRGGDVVVIMEEGWLMATSIINRGLIQREWGEHGWDPGLPSMKAIFMLSGPGIPAGVTIPEVENIDVYPLMTELLGLHPATGLDGQSGKIRSLLK
jgi:predicted AlkP superfamily pyrophosphatase or phosphodiesterase